MLVLATCATLSVKFRQPVNLTASLFSIQAITKSGLTNIFAASQQLESVDVVEVVYKSVQTSTESVDHQRLHSIETKAT